MIRKEPSCAALSLIQYAVLSSGFAMRSALKGGTFLALVSAGAFAWFSWMEALLRGRRSRQALRAK